MLTAKEAREKTDAYFEDLFNEAVGMIEKEIVRQSSSGRSEVDIYLDGRNEVSMKSKLEQYLRKIGYELIYQNVSDKQIKFTILW